MRFTSLLILTMAVAALAAPAQAKDKKNSMTFPPLPAVPSALAPPVTEAEPAVTSLSKDTESEPESESEPKPTEVTPLSQRVDYSNPDVFDSTRDARMDVDDALAAAAKARKYTLVVMGGNWCHDSDALTGHFLKPEFQTLFKKHYEVVYVDVGYKDRNLDIARSFGLDGIVGTPTVAIVSPKGGILNLDSAVTWRHSANMDGDDILRYFNDFAVEARKARL